MEERSRRDWEARKKRIFEELGGRVGAEGKAGGELRKSVRASTALGVGFSKFYCGFILLFSSQHSTASPLSNNLQMQSKMLAYDQSVTDLNRARLRGTSFPIVHALLKISQDIATDVSVHFLMFRAHDAKKVLA